MEKVRGAGGAPDVWGELKELDLISLEKGRLGRWGTSLQFLAIEWWVAEKTVKFFAELHFERPRASSHSEGNCKWV